MVSILSGRKTIKSYGNNIMNSKLRKPLPHPVRGDLSAEAYIHLLDIYAQVVTFYVDFFIDYWYENDVNETNEKMKRELERVGITRWAGLTEEESKTLGEYVLSLDCPASVDDMKEFFNRVMLGDLAFLSRYPIGDSNAYGMIKGLGKDF